MRPVLLYRVMMLLSIVLLSGCGAQAATAPIASPTAHTTTSATKSASPVANPTSASSTVYPLTVTDDSGTTVTFAERPRHVVSMSPSSTEIVYAVGGGDVFTAGTQYDNYPEAAKSKARIKGLKPSLETILALQPDLVLADLANSPDLVRQLRSAHVPVIDLDAHDFQGVYHDILLVGQVLDGLPAAQRVVIGMQAEVKEVSTKTAGIATRPRVFVELSVSGPSTIFTVGPGSFVDALVTLAGGVNVAHGAKSPYPQFSLESLVSEDPEIVILDDGAYGVTVDAVAQRPGWSSMSAVKEHHVYTIDDDLVSRPGPRLADGLTAMAKLIHPELFR